MANGHGGYRAPANPAPVSGPGAHSKRTDGKANQMALPDAAYGEGADFQEMQSGAQMGSGNAPSPGGQAMPTPQAPQVVPLTEGSTMADTPVTAGADYGAGPSSRVLGLGPAQQDVEQYGKYLPFLLKLANDPNTSKSTRTAIRQLFANS